jgi:hypothetical protein
MRWREGEIPLTQRHAMMVACPKDEKLIDIIDTHEDDGRLVTYGGFTGTIDRIVGVYTKMKWNWIRVDGRGWSCSWGAKNPQEMLSEFQDKNSRIEKCGFIGHPGSAGMGLTLTRSSETVFFSNDFNGESRIQAVDRIHRPGMDVNKGATITDLLHLPTDRLVLGEPQEEAEVDEYVARAVSGRDAGNRGEPNGGASDVKAMIIFDTGDGIIIYKAILTAAEGADGVAPQPLRRDGRDVRGGGSVPLRYREIDWRHHEGLRLSFFLKSCRICGSSLNRRN